MWSVWLYRWERPWRDGGGGINLKCADWFHTVWLKRCLCAHATATRMFFLRWRPWDKPSVWNQPLNATWNTDLWCMSYAYLYVCDLHVCHNHVICIFVCACVLCNCMHVWWPSMCIHCVYWLHASCQDTEAKNRTYIQVCSECLCETWVYVCILHLVYVYIYIYILYMPRWSYC